MSGPRTCSRKTTPSSGTGGSPRVACSFHPGHTKLRSSPRRRTLLPAPVLSGPVPELLDGHLRRARPFAAPGRGRLAQPGHRRRARGRRKHHQRKRLPRAAAGAPHGPERQPRRGRLRRAGVGRGNGRDGQDDGDARATRSPGSRPTSRRSQTDDFFADPKGQAAGLLGNATSRIVYDVTRFHRWQQAQASQPPSPSAPRPPGFGATIVTGDARERPGGAPSAVQVSLSYTRRLRPRDPAQGAGRAGTAGRPADRR